MKKSLTFLIFVLALVVLVFSGIAVFRYLQKPEEKPIALEIKTELTFARYDFKPSTFTPNLPDYQITLGEISNIQQLEEADKRKFTEAQKEELRNKHFFIARNGDKFYEDNPQEISSRLDDWAYLYSQIGGPDVPQLRRPEHAVFVTADFLLHIYHRLLEKTFEFLEQRTFYPKIRKISNTMLDAALKAYQDAPAGPQKESFQRLIAFFAVPTAILDAAHEFYEREQLEDSPADAPGAIVGNLEKLKDRMPPEAYQLARQELDLVLAADQVTPSPLLGKYQEEQGLSLPEDYTQYGPRSHYRKNPVLRAYFRTMMWYGRMNFLLSSPQLTRDAANMTLLLAKADLVKDWQDINLPISFLVGETDDLGISEYRQALQQLTTDQDATGVTDELITRLQGNLKRYRSPQILSAAAIGVKVWDLSKEELRDKTKGFRFMGQRFTPDAFMFSYLTQGEEKPDPKTGERLPSMPTALMVASLLGSKTAEPLLAEWIDRNAPQAKGALKNRMAVLNKYFHNLPAGNWTQNIYWGWLYTLQSLYQEAKSKTGYPMFMKNSDWNRKDLQCSLGSWTELKHDTLLYAKQVYAEMGNGEELQEIPPVPRGYVEPNIDFFDRFIPLVKMTKEGLEQRELLENEFLQRHHDFLDAVEFFRRIALAQLQNDMIADDDFERLRLEPGNLRWMVRPLPGEEGTENYARSALIADVFTDMLTGRILYEATGIPNYIYVTVKDQNGARLTKGLVFSYYEFTSPLGKRLTDEQWREWNYTQDNRKMPAMADWAKSLIK